jgi:ABC-type polysaccharide/polyol phosphate export permease
MEFDSVHREIIMHFPATDKTMLKSLWIYRYFIFSSIKTEFRVRFLRSRIGGLWMIINPLVQVLMFVFVIWQSTWLGKYMVESEPKP